MREIILVPHAWHHVVHAKERHAARSSMALMLWLELVV
jgi:hypothetical protein